jgi:NAD(P)H dehydrogenase (quinone)
MPVVVTGASGLIGRRAVQAFTLVSPQVRAYVRRPEVAEPLRSLGAKVAVGPIEDVETLEVVMSGAHTVCHLVGGLNPKPPDEYERSIVGSVRSVAEGAARAGVRRLLYVSYPGASAEEANDYLRSAGMAEQVIRACGLEYVIVRCARVYDEESEWLQAVTRRSRMNPALVVGTGRQLLAPIHANDVAAVLAGADDRERVDSGTWGLEGPDRITADDLADLLAGKPKRKVHLSAGAGARVTRLTGERSTLASLELQAADSLADAPDAAAEFGVRLTPLREGLSRSLPDMPE